MGKGSVQRAAKVPKHELKLRWEYLTASESRKAEIKEELKKMKND